jgi:hypothetical protein
MHMHTAFVNTHNRHGSQQCGRIGGRSVRTCAASAAMTLRTHLAAGASSAAHLCLKLWQEGAAGRVGFAGLRSRVAADAAVAPVQVCTRAAAPDGRVGQVHLLCVVGRRAVRRTDACMTAVTVWPACQACSLAAVLHQDSIADLPGHRTTRLALDLGQLLGLCDERSVGVTRGVARRLGPLAALARGTLLGRHGVAAADDAGDKRAVAAELGVGPQQQVHKVGVAERELAAPLLVRPDTPEQCVCAQARVTADCPSAGHVTRAP